MLALNDQLARLLSDQGFSVRQCHDGQKGLLAALNEIFDLILLEVLLPAINGFSVLKPLRSVKHTPAIPRDDVNGMWRRIKKNRGLQ
jgi:two-component system response regulator PfeR